MCRMLLFMLLLVASPSWALTNGSMEIGWTPTVDSTIRYELRWKHFNNGWTWTPLVAGLDSTTGRYQLTFAPLPETTGDRGVCVDARAVRGTLVSAWVSESGGQACAQMPVAAVVVPPVVVVPPPLPPPPSGTTATVSTLGDTVKVQCDPAKYLHAKTTGTGNKRTITCLP